MGGSALWLGRYAEPLPVRSRGAFHVVSVQRGEGPRTIVVHGSRGTDPDRVREALAEIARVHGLVDHVRVPRVVELGEHEGTPFLELGCDAVIDGHEVLRLLADASQKLSYGEGDAVFTLLRETLQAAHRVVDPRTGRPICLGRVSFGNFFFSPSGQMWIAGLGHNFPIEREDGEVEGYAPVFQAPEVLAGAPPTPIADYVAVLMAARSLTSFCDLAEILRRVLAAAVSPDNAELFHIVRWFDTRFISEQPGARPSIEEGLAQSQRLRVILGVQLDPAGLSARVASLIAAQEPPSAGGDENEVVAIAGDGGWIAIGNGPRQVLGRAHRQILRALITARKQSVERTLTVWDLLEAGWPGEDPVPDAGANRVYVAITRLRRLGLRHAIERDGDGYRLRPGAPLRFVG